MPKKRIIPFRNATAEYDALAEREQNIVGRRIAEARKNADYSSASFADALISYGVDVCRSSVGKWERGESSPNAYQLIAVCRMLGITDYNFFTTHPPKQELNEEGQKKLADYKSDLIASGKYNPYSVVTSIQYIDMDVSTLPVSAGTGNLLDEENFEKISFPADAVPAGAEFGIRVTGDSMEPVYHDRQIVWVQRCTQLRPGEVGIFVYDGAGYLKVYEEQKPEDEEAYTDSYGMLHMQPVLLSYNPAYEPRVISQDAEFKIIGRILK